MNRFRTLLALLVILVFAAAPLFAQGETPTPGSTNWYSSVGGIVLATGILVQILKRALGSVTLLQDVPIWVYSVGVAVGLTWFCESVLHTLNGGLYTDINQAVLFAAAASGFYSWISGPMKSPATS